MDMLSKTGPFPLETVRPILAPNGNVTSKEVTQNFYQELYTEFDGFGGHALISQHGFGEPWDTWEMHPKGDEIVGLIKGDIDFILWINGAEHILHVHEPGSYIVVPKGIWHTARPRTYTEMFFVTPGEGTQLAAGPEEFD